MESIGESNLNLKGGVLMGKKLISMGDIACTIYDCENPNYVIIQPVDEHDLEVLDNEMNILLKEAGNHILLVAVHIENWNEQLSPWPASAVFGKTGFGGQAKLTLDYIEHQLLPYVIESYKLSDTIPVILGGYSLAGLFALWCAYESNRFSAIAAVSPSVWFPKWLEFAHTHRPLVNTLYLSLGDKEERTKNAVMATVGDGIRAQLQLLEEQGTICTLEWNKGNHFQDSDLRCAKGFTWCLKNV